MLYYLIALVTLLFLAVPAYSETDKSIEYIDRSKFLCMFPDHKVDKLDEKLKALNKGMQLLYQLDASINLYLAFNEYKITRRQRIVHYFVQAGVETDNFTTFTERINKDRSCDSYDGGCTFIGRGPLQIRHKRNYALLGKSMGVDFVAKPDLLSGHEYFFKASAAYWDLKGLNKLADVGNMTTITETLLEGMPLQLKRRNMTLSWVELCLPDSVVISPQIPRCGFCYKTRKSDSLYVIGMRYGVYISAIIENNVGVIDEDVDPHGPLPLGLVLYIPKCW